MHGWHDQVALVTGASGAIGMSITEHLVSLGARVAGADLVTTGAPSPTDVRTFEAVDVAKSEALDKWVASVSGRWGYPTIGVICAGISRSGRLIDTSDDDWNEVLDVNLTGAFYSARAIIRAMLAGGAGGRIVFVGSWAAHAPHPHIGAYSASKAGLRALCQTLALDHAQDGILLNEVAPGIVDAGLSRELFRQDPELEIRTRAAIPSGLVIRPEDVARDVAYLASPENRHTTGTTLISDGGLSLASSMNPGRARNQ
jgi:glucose 1-dehydrogenase